MFNFKFSTVDTSSNYYGNSIDSSYLEMSSEYHTYKIDNSIAIDEIVNNSIFTNKINTGLMPPGVRHLSPGLVIFERPPSMQLVQYVNNTVEQMQTDDYDECLEDCDNDECYGSCRDEFQLEPIQQYYIPVPWQLYIATYSTDPASAYLVTSVRMFFMNTPLNHSDVNLYAPYIPNFFANGTLCNPMFDSYTDIDRYQKNISGVIESTYDWIWNTGFNADLYECVHQTYIQKPNSIVEDIASEKSKYPYSNVIHRLYSELSSYTPEQVTQHQWISPSFSSHFQSDRYNLQHYAFAFQDYIDATGSEDTQLDESNQDRFHHWLKDDTSLESIPKTYRNVLSYLFNDKHIPKNTISSELYLRSPDHYMSTMYSLAGSRV